MSSISQRIIKRKVISRWGTVFHPPPCHDSPGEWDHYDHGNWGLHDQSETTWELVFNLAFVDRDLQLLKILVSLSKTELPHLGLAQSKGSSVPSNQGLRGTSEICIILTPWVWVTRQGSLYATNITQKEGSTRGKSIRSISQCVESKQLPVIFHLLVALSSQSTRPHLLPLFQLIFPFAVDPLVSQKIHQLFSFLRTWWKLIVRRPWRWLWILWKTWISFQCLETLSGVVPLWIFCTTTMHNSTSR